LVNRDLQKGLFEQGSPAIALDPHGDLHLIWDERAALPSPTRLRYLRGDFDED
jgi:hypothetical protein